MRNVLLELKPNVRPCGKHNLKLPALGMGCWAYGGGEYWGPHSQAEVNRVVHYAIDRGCNFFDTAEAYNDGASESSLGRALKGIAREKVIIGTKISPCHTAPQSLVEHCEASLRRLQADYVDLYMVHWPITSPAIRHFSSENLPIPSVADAFATLSRLKQQGKIRHIGVSNFGEAKLQEALDTGVEIVANELPYSLLTRGIEVEMLPFCRASGIGVIGYMALMQGVLTNTYRTLADVPQWRRRTRHFDCRRTLQCRHGLPGAEAETNATLHAVRSLAAQHNMTVSEIALKWTFAQEGIASSLCGSRTVAQLESNLKAAAEPLAPGIIDELNRVSTPLLQKLGAGFDYYEHPDNDRTK